jgi:hypothetical protein
VAAAVFEPTLHYYLAAHEDAGPSYHHLNNWGNLVLAGVVFFALLRTARLLGERLLAVAASVSLSVTALNVSVNEFALGSSLSTVWPIIFLLGIMYAIASLLFSLAFLRCRELMGWLSPALGMTWFLAVLVNLAASASFILGNADLFWWALNAGVALSVASHVLFSILFLAVRKTSP